jgi:archaemetzincin
MKAGPPTVVAATLAILAVLSCLTPVFADSEPKRLAIQPFGKFDAALLEYAKEAVSKAFGVEVEVLPAKDIPAAAHYKPRGRHRAEKILDWLDSNTEAKFGKVVGLAATDISTTKDDIYDWGIFGLGTLGGRPSVVSTFRLKKDKPSGAKLKERFFKVLVHEVGHTFGLPHCQTKGCLMQDAKGTIKTVDAEGTEFCAECKAKLKTVKSGQ